MTRDEADRIATNSNCGYVLEFLEKIGAVKFDEPKPSKPTAEMVIRSVLDTDYVTHSRHYATTIINDLLKYKYKIVDTDIFEVTWKK